MIGLIVCCVAFRIVCVAVVWVGGVVVVLCVCLCMLFLFALFAFFVHLRCG